MKQYKEIKIKYPDSILLFRVGDFYETFGEDAIKTSEILNIILTKKGIGSISEVELAGFPYHSLNNHLPKLVKAGCRVAICDQLEDPKSTKKIVKRGVTELVTPGLAIIDSVLDKKRNNYISSIYNYKKDLWGISFLDLSTGDFHTDQVFFNELIHLLNKYNPNEILVSKKDKSIFELKFDNKFHAYYIEDWIYEYEFCKDKILSQFNLKNLKGFGIENLNSSIISSGVILHYLSETHNEKINHINSIKKINSSNYLTIDNFTSRNLEIFNTLNSEGKSLLDTIDRTLTSMGSRLFRNWLSFPEKNLNEICYRNSIVEFFINDIKKGEDLLDELKDVIDIERAISKISTIKISPRELVQLKKSLEIINRIVVLLSKIDFHNIKKLYSEFENLNALIDTISKTINDDAPVNLAKGNYINQNFSKELDDLKSSVYNNKKNLEKMQEEEILKTGISSLKISFNNIFGYYIEVRNTHKDKVPSDWTRKQTLVGSERYINSDLKKYESKILGAEEKIKLLENQIYLELLKNIQSFLVPLKKQSYLISKLDCLLSFFVISKENKYSCPKFNNSKKIEIINGRHPVIEAFLPIGENYIPNDIYLDDTTQQIIIITGPNMSGKSAIIRQTAIISLMAQIGCFVPAESANLCVLDNIFSRVGASDNISAGESTFMVEMNESASILNNITENSLVLLDEIGRGTSTYDGISIAWSIAQYLHENKNKPKTLFATHYHELNEMSKSFERIKNFNVSIKELKDDIIFLRKLKEGGTAHSFGIHVAKMAGMPNEVIKNAEKKLKFLESSNIKKSRTIAIDEEINQTKIEFSPENNNYSEVIDNIKKLDLNSLSPIDALLSLNEIKKKLKS